ncbi:MAG: ROK family protein [Acholeplasmatales bacterium]|nr:ROK family protein [Acholeplasmatales bacterium]
MRVGVDVGGTTVKIGFIDKGEFVHTYAIKTTKTDLFDNICKSIKEYAEENNITIEGIGFGMPGHVGNNYIDRLPNIGLADFNIEAHVKKYFPNVIIKSTNDANAAALGEYLNEHKYNSAYMITLGTGVGGGYIVDGKVVEGFNNNTGEIGHMVIDFEHNYKCSCGLSGCLETVSSATGLVRLAYEYKNKFKSNIDFDNITAKEVCDKAKEGDELACRVVDFAMDKLALAISYVVLTVNPEVIILGGGVADAGDFLIDIIQKKYQQYAHYAVTNLNIIHAKLGNKAGMLGAAYLW